MPQMSAPGAAAFAKWNTLLREAGQGQPCLLLDLDALRHNISVARGQIAPGLGARVVAKSLASVPLLDMAVEGLGALGVMTFSAGMAADLLAARPEWSQLMGKPLPVAAARRLLSANRNAASRVIWLIDTPTRAAQYSALTDELNETLMVALELDIGLHRGGVPPSDWAAQIAALAAAPGLSLRGVMGYEAHLAKLPAPLQRREAARIRHLLRQSAEALATHGAGALVNTGGSLTFGRYGLADGVSEVSLGSVLVKPGDFDKPGTAAFRPALFIATPILKYAARNPVPGLGAVGRALARPMLAIHGGYWKARPVYPPGFKVSSVYGASSNQEVWQGPPLGASPVDEFAFLHPQQSEAVISEFGALQTVEAGRLGARWPVMQTL